MVPKTGAVKAIQASFDRQREEREAAAREHDAVVSASLAMKYALADALIAYLSPICGTASEVIVWGMEPLPEGEYRPWVRPALAALRAFEVATGVRPADTES